MDIRHTPGDGNACQIIVESKRITTDAADRKTVDIGRDGHRPNWPIVASDGEGIIGICDVCELPLECES
jgi:malic enzyme